MRTIGRGLFLIVSLATAAIANAWDDTGHMVIATIAYQHLTPTAKREADEILRVGGTDRTKDFVDAACWADDVRRDRRETGPWHYIDFYFRSDGKPVTNQPDAENVVWAIEKFKKILANKSESPENRAEALRFLLHFVGDIHQPLHSVSRVTDALPAGDAGGNKFHIEPPVGLGGDYPPKNLHSLWDEGCGLFPSTPHDYRPLSAEHRSQIEAIAHKIESDRPLTRDVVSVQDPLAWAKSGLKISQSFVYSLPENTAPTEAYLAKGREISETRAAEAGYRLADLLNSVLK